MAADAKPTRCQRASGGKHWNTLRGRWLIAKPGDSGMAWQGKWKNQYGSLVEITDDANNEIVGTFQTALKDSGFYGQSIPVLGVHHGDCISFVCGGDTPAGSSVVSYTGLPV